MGFRNLHRPLNFNLKYNTTRVLQGNDLKKCIFFQLLLKKCTCKYFPINLENTLTNLNLLPEGRRYGLGLAQQVSKHYETFPTGAPRQQGLSFRHNLGNN
jgi:hypothetical protein